MKRELKYKVDPNKDKVKPESIGSVSKNDTVYLTINVENLTDDSNKIKVDILGEKGEDDNKVLIEQKDNEKVEKEGINIKIKLKEAFVSTEGMVNLNIKFVDEEGTITIIGPYFYVNKTFEGDIVEDKDTIDTLEEIKREAEQLIKKVDDKLNGITSGGGSGKTWRPSVSEDGLLSWSEDNSDIPPESVNIIGPQGRPGIDGRDGRDGIDGKQGLPGRDGEQGPKGDNGITPHIGDNGNWFIGNEDTGRPSRGRDGGIGPQGPKGEDGAFNPNIEFDNLNTNDKTVIGAINEVKKNVDSIPIDDFATKEKIEGQAEVLNGWKLTGNKINKLTKFNIGFTIFDFQVTAVQEIAAGTVCFMIPPEFTPVEPFKPISISIGNSMGSGFIYKNGQVKFNGTYSKGAIVTGSCIIINK
ncbi:hypothetical protein [Clostridium baratii]|uniref:collagen-like triple helix repeat-containing protein n=1 Tax=Clostridium baratii TaxID=1561 RepID=UPI0030D07C85